MFIRRELLESLPFPRLEPAPDAGPERAETGTQNQEGIAGITATIDFLASLGGGTTRRERLAQTFDRFHRDGQRLGAMLWNGLASIRGLRLYGPPPSEPRTPTVSFTVDGMTAEEVSRRLAKRALFASHGDFYAQTVIERLGVEGLVRIGCACYTTDEEVARLLEEVERISSRA